MGEDTGREYITMPVKEQTETITEIPVLPAEPVIKETMDFCGMREIVTEKPEMPEAKKERKMKNFSQVTGVLLVIFLAIAILITSCILAMELSEGFKKKVLTTLDVWSGKYPAEQENTAATPTPTAVPEEKDGKLSENLAKAAAEIPQHKLNGFTPGTEILGGNLYLTFTRGEYKVAYKNEYRIVDGRTQGEVRISNGAKAERFAWSYHVTEDLSELCPMVGDYCGNGREQLVFSFTERENAASNYLHIIAGNTLLEYYFIAPDDIMDTIVTAYDFMDAGHATLASLVSNDRTYYVSLPHCAKEEAEELYKVRNDVRMRYLVTENAIQLESYVELGEGHFIGKVTGKVTPSKNDIFSLTGATFYLFAEDDFCDLDSMGIGVPVTEAELFVERVPVTGDYGERLLVPVREDVEKHSYKPDNFKKDENGLLGYYENGKKITLTGIDVSKWQNTIDWKKVGATGIVDYAIIRLGYRGTAQAGNTALDPKFVENIEGALAEGIQVGVYYFTQARTVEEAIEEARIVLENIKDYPVTFPVVFDTEYTAEGRANNLSNADRTACAKAFCDTILAAGYTPAIYANTTWSILDLNLEELQGYDFWYAYYGEELYYPYNFTMWQYTDSGKLDGIPTNVDFNISFVDYSTR